MGIFKIDNEENEENFRKYSHLIDIRQSWQNANRTMLLMCETTFSHKYASYIEKKTMQQKFVKVSSWYIFRFFSQL